MKTTEQAAGVWAAVLGHLQLQVTRPSYQTWLKDTIGISCNDGELVVGTPNTFVAEMLEQRMYSLISQATERVTRRHVELRFQVVAQDGAPGRSEALLETEEPERPYASCASEAGSPRANGPSAQPALFRNQALNPRYTFDTFIVGSSNELSHAAALAVSERPGVVYNPLVIYSDVGLGKTHLLHAIGHGIQASGLSVVYATTEEFTNEYIKAIRDGRTEEFRNRYRSADVLLLDDIQFLIGKDQTQEGFFHTFNALHMTNKQIVISSDRPVASLSLLEDRIRSRLAGGLVVDIQSPDLETRLAILRTKAETSGWTVAAEVIQFLGERVHKNVRELEGALNRVAAYARLTKQPMNLETVKSAIDDASRATPTRPISDQMILDAVAAYFLVPDHDLKSRKRDKKTATARHVAMYLLRGDADLGPTAIGRLLGGKDHTTVLHGCQRIASRMDVDAHLRRDVINIREALATA